MPRRAISSNRKRAEPIAPSGKPRRGRCPTSAPSIERCDRPFLEAARAASRELPAPTTRPLLLPKSEIDRDRSEVVDRPQRRARDLDSDMDGVDQLGRLLERETGSCPAAGARADPEQEFGLAGGETLGEDRHIGHRRHLACTTVEDRPREPVGVESSDRGGGIRPTFQPITGCGPMRRSRRPGSHRPRQGRRQIAGISGESRRRAARRKKAVGNRGCLRLPPVATGPRDSR